MKRALSLLVLLCLLLCACGVQETGTAAEPVESMPLSYAENFAVDYYTEDAAVLTLGGTDRYLLLKQDAKAPAAFAELPVIRYPVERVYLASSSAADLFDRIGALDCVAFTSTKAADWRLDAMRAALEDGAIQYAGKYSAPDYELLLEEGTDLIVENTMVFHTPAVQEKLVSLGFPLLVEYSSYEPHPLGRVEWIKLYGLLTGHLAEAEAFFDEQIAAVQAVETAESSGKTVAFFHFSPNGAVVVRRSADYVTRMIELAGGESAFTDLPEDDKALSTVTIQMESFYTQAKDADVLVYNSTVAGDLADLDALLAQNPLMADFKAVQTGNVWCTEQSMFQRSSAAAGMITDFHRILTGSNDTLQFLHKLN